MGIKIYIKKKKIVIIQEIIKYNIQYTQVCNIFFYFEINIWYFFKSWYEEFNGSGSLFSGKF